MAPSHADPVANAGRTGTIAFESAITQKTPRQTTRRYALMADPGYTMRYVSRFIGECVWMWYRL